MSYETMGNRKGVCLGLVLTTAGLLPQLAMAQAANASIEPAQIEKRFEPDQRPLSTSKPILVPKEAGLAAPQGAADIRFVLTGLQIDGVTVFSQEELSELYGELLTTEISLDRVYEIATQVTARYGNAGYMLSRAIVPPQEIEGGKVRIQVIEGYIDQVEVEGLEGQRTDLFDYYMQKITSSRPLHSSALERYLLLANDLPGVKFKSVVRPSEKNVGAATLVLNATTKPWEGGISLDNRGSRTSGPWQLLAEGSGNDLLGRLESTTLRVATVPGSHEELHYWQLSHLYTINGEGLRLGLELSSTDSEPGGDVLRALQVETKGRTLLGQLSYPMIRSREKNLTLTGGLDFRQSETLQLGAVTADDQLMSLRLGASYDQADTFGGGGINLMAVTLSHGLNAFGAQAESRAGAEPDYTKLELLLRRNQRLGELFSADMRINAQMGSGSLPSSEQFSLGGERNVRGYEPAEWTGDDAMTASLDLIYRPKLNWQGDVQLYGFYDYGKVWRANPQVGEAEDDHASAFGLGTRVQLPKNFAFNFELANPQRSDSSGEEHSWQLYTRLRATF